MSPTGSRRPADQDNPDKPTTLSLRDDPEPALQRAREQRHVEGFARVIGGLGWLSSSRCCTSCLTTTSCTSGSSPRSSPAAGAFPRVVRRAGTRRSSLSVHGGLARRVLVFGRWAC